jgi:uncharacterized protein YqgV (UPF0045/DUF77 family)
MSPKKETEVFINVTPQDELNQRIADAVANCEELIHNLRLSYDLKPNKRVSDIIVAQELSLMELKALVR